MNRIVKRICGATTIAAVAVSSPALAGKGLGDAYNLKYESYGISYTDRSNDGAIAMDVEEIATVNCGGCDVIWYGPGLVFHLRNTTKAARCVSVVFTPKDDRNWQLYRWGSGKIYYLKAGKSLKKVGGIYTVSTGGQYSVDLGYSFAIHSWAPIGKNACGADPYT